MSRIYLMVFLTIGLLSTKSLSLVTSRTASPRSCRHISSRPTWQMGKLGINSCSYQRSRTSPSELGVAGTTEVTSVAFADSSDASAINDGQLNAESDEDEVLWQDGRGDALCRICASADGEIPTSKHLMPQYLVESDLMKKLDAIYNAMSHAETCTLKYFDTGKRGRGKGDLSDIEDSYDEDEEKRLVSIIRTALDNAGFEILRRRDLDLCEALNVGYLLRLSILPDVKSLDPCIGQEFFSEKFVTESAGDNALDGKVLEKLLFEGRVLVFRRGYAEEVTKGRLLLPKLDYLQASLVQRSAAVVTSFLGRIERRIGAKVAQGGRAVRQAVRVMLSDVADSIPSEKISAFVKSKWGWKNEIGDLEEENASYDEKENKVLKLDRYGGSKVQFIASPDLSDALNSFLVCEIDYGSYGERAVSANRSEPVVNIPERGMQGSDVDYDIYEVLNTGQVTCEYDDENSLDEPMQLLKRVSINNLVDFFSPQGRKGIIRGFFEKAKLVEPTYEEVVVIWRPLPERTKPKIAPPQSLYDAAEIFGVEDRLPRKPRPLPDPKPVPLKIRAFTAVPMANLPAVLPKTRLVFRPADAFVFDLVSLFSLAAVLASQRFDNPKFDLIAVVSVTLWVIRTFFRYSNKLARYDLLVNKFLTSRISHRGPGAVKYLTTEAGSQRATRAGLLYTWLREVKDSMDGQQSMGGESESVNVTPSALSREAVMQRGSSGMNNLLRCDRRVKINVTSALHDLEDLGAIRFSADGEIIDEIKTEREFLQSMKTKWEAIFE